MSTNNKRKSPSPSASKKDPKSKEPKVQTDEDKRKHEIAEKKNKYVMSGLCSRMEDPKTHITYKEALNEKADINKRLKRLSKDGCLASFDSKSYIKAGYLFTTEELLYHLNIVQTIVFPEMFPVEKKSKKSPSSGDDDDVTADQSEEAEAEEKKKEAVVSSDSEKSRKRTARVPQ